MNKIVKICEKSNILNLLNDFKDVFPGLAKRVASLDAYADKLDKFAEVYCVKNGSDIIGLVVFYANDIETKKGYITLIGIKKDAEHRGLGTYLLEECISVMKSKGIKTVELEVDNNNIHAFEFYKRNGFSVCHISDRNSKYLNKKI